MRRPLVDSANPLWRNALGAIAAAALIAVAVIVKLITMSFERPQRRTAEEVAQYLRGFLEDAGGDWDWDDFTSMSLADPNLESIRRRAADVSLPVSEEGRSRLITLLAEAEGLAERDSPDLYGPGHGKA